MIRRWLSTLPFGHNSEEENSQKKDLPPHTLDYSKKILDDKSAASPDSGEAITIETKLRGLMAEIAEERVKIITDPAAKIQIDPELESTYPAKAVQISSESPIASTTKPSAAPLPPLADSSRETTNQVLTTPPSIKKTPPTKEKIKRPRPLGQVIRFPAITHTLPNKSLDTATVAPSPHTPAPYAIRWREESATAKDVPMTPLTKGIVRTIALIATAVSAAYASKYLPELIENNEPNKSILTSKPTATALAKVPPATSTSSAQTTTPPKSTASEQPQAIPSSSSHTPPHPKSSAKSKK